MNDRELLELAAKAADIENDGQADWRKRRGLEWNPLANDGDALRLAVRLRMEVNNIVPDAPVFVYAANPGMIRAREEKGADPYAATRRAIVRAAAEIGKAMP